MSTRVHIVMDDAERQAFRRAAAREGLSLSDWLRRAARDRLEAQHDRGPDSVTSLRAFFAECDRRESGREPEWGEHLGVIEASRRTGRADP